jgi:dihydrofolate synthase/folylpolyglutamate synthase
MPKIDKAYEQTTEYLFSQLPMYQRIGDAAMKKDLTNIIALCKHLGNPQDTFPTIHIAGTNGKGSTTHILAAILQETGKKVGIYTSPHYKDFRERIKVGNTLASKEFIVNFVKENKKILKKIQPSFFEISVAMAFDYFAKEKVDIAIIETGLGGRLDSTNIITPILSIITNISLDHQSFLGNTLEKIAAEKAGIIKKDVPIVIAEDNPTTAPVFIKKAKEMNAPIHFSKDNYSVIPTVNAFTHSIFNIYKSKRLYMRDIESDVAGQFQAENIRGVIQAVYILNELGYDISDQQTLDAFKKVKSSTYFIGRMHIVKYAPFIVADSGHNEGALSKTLDELQKIEYRNLHIVLGFVNDKDIKKMLSLFPKDATYYFTEADIPRALPVAELSKIANKIGLEGELYENVKDALAAARSVVSLDDCIFIGGSTFVVAEVI